ncbi:L,D-transpeptidase [Camelimonas abortus]|uniref:L,D-transpeptidase n=1 Tax=Camelimonas abortus TaxID=1017184 RepID=A0ABV7LDK5_9HYPH
METTRRDILLGGLAAAAACAAPAAARAAKPSWFDGVATDHGVTYRRTNFAVVDPRWRRQLVRYRSAEPPGVVVVDTRNHFLYLVFENQTALRYGVGVGKEGFQWFGRARIDRKAVWPAWTPPAEMRRRNPKLPEHMPGGPDNPLGPRALYLAANGRDTGYRLHGTTDPSSIGRDASSGCIRLFPEDIIDLYQRCPVGAEVLVLPHIAARAAG